MSERFSDPRWKAALATAAVFALGVIVGIAIDRLGTGRAPERAAAAPLTVEALAEALDLESDDRARVREVVDSLENAIARASAEGPASLRAAAQEARQQLEAALPADRRGRFRSWMEGHHARMMDAMRRHGTMGRMMDEHMRGRMMRGRGGMMGPGTQRPDSEPSPDSAAGGGGSQQ